MAIRSVTLGALLAGLLAGCSAPAPVLYPNPHLNQVGRVQADNDIADCRQLAEASGARASAGGGQAQGAATSAGAGALLGAAAGAVGGAVAGSAGTGAAIGAAGGATTGLLQSLFSSPQVSSVHKTFVDRCLRERGYDIVGWE